MSLSGVLLGVADREPLRAVLLACAIGDTGAACRALSRCSATGLERLPDAAAYHGISPTVWRVLGETGELEASIEVRLQEATFGSRAVALRVGEDLKAVSEVLDRAGTPWAVVKGPVLAERYYDGHAPRSYGDLDLLVDPSTLGAVLDLLQGAGSTLIDTNWSLIRESGRGELSLSLPAGTVLDLHWSLVTERAIRRQLRVSGRDALSRARRLDLRAGSIPTLDPVDTLLHVGLHACLSGGGQLGWYLDLKRVVEAEQLDWDEVVRRAERTGVGLHAAVMLGRTRSLLGLEVAQEILDHLGAGEWWCRGIRLLDRVRRSPPPYRVAFSTQAVVSATRTTSAGSARALSAAVGRDLASPAERHRDVARQVNPLHVGGGTKEDRRAFLCDIVAEEEGILRLLRGHP